VGYKLAAEMGARIHGRLGKNTNRWVAANVTENIYNRHNLPLVPWGMSRPGLSATKGSGILRNI